MARWPLCQGDALALSNTLENTGLSTAVLAVALAWQAGLSRQELQQLTWAQVDMTQGQLRLPQRTIVLQGRLLQWLPRWHATHTNSMVVLTGQQGSFSAPSLSRLVGHFFTTHHLAPLCLSDLRHSYICAQLSHRSWGSMCHELGLQEEALRKAYGKHVTPPATEHPPFSPEAIHHLLTAQPPSLGLLAVALAWEEGLSPQELRSLTWPQLTAFPLHAQAHSIAQTLLQNPTALQGQDMVFPFSAPHLSRLARQAFLLEGLGGITLQTLAGVRSRQVPQLMALLAQHQGLSIRQVSTALALPLSTVRTWLSTLARLGLLVQVNMYYYSARQVPPRAQHTALVLSHAQRQGTVYADDVHGLLHLRPSQCRHLLRTLVEEGLLEHKGLGYVLTKN